jgi:hypothetical protein
MDVNGGQLVQTNGNPVFPGSQFTGPLLAGNIVHSDGSGILAGLGGSAGGIANVGYAHMTQSAVVSQTTTSGQSAGVFVSTIVIPAQSQITAIHLMVTTAWTTGTTTLGVGTTAGTTAGTSLTSATAIQGSTAGLITSTPTTTAQIANWDNTSNATFQAGGPVDIQIIITSGGGIGSGVGLLTVEYVQGINNAL